MQGTTSPTGGRTATAVAFINNGNGALSSIVITDGGSGYTAADLTADLITISAPNGTQAEARITATVNASILNTVTLSVTGVSFSPLLNPLNTPGAGYTSAPTVTFSDGVGDSGTGAAGIAIMTPAIPATVPASLMVGSVLIGTGTGYSVPPLITIMGGTELNNTDYAFESGPVTLAFATYTYSNPQGNASGATAISSIYGPITSVVLTAQGTGYTSPPPINFGGINVVNTATAYTTLEANVVQQGINSQINMFSGFITLGATPNVLFYGTGTANNGAADYYGTGVYESTDYGETWNLLIDPTLSNSPDPGDPLFGLAINQIIFDPDGFLYVATTDFDTDSDAAGLDNTIDAPTELDPGVWRYDLAHNTWLNLTDLQSTDSLRDGQTAPGPDDVFSNKFPQKDADWTSLALSGGVLYASQGAADPGMSTGVNEVYHLTNPEAVDNSANPPTWYVGTPDLTSALDYPIVTQPNSQLSNFAAATTALDVWNPGNGNIQIQSTSANTIIATITYGALPKQPPGLDSHTIKSLFDQGDRGEHQRRTHLDRDVGSFTPGHHAELHGQRRRARLGVPGHQRHNVLRRRQRLGQRSGLGRIEELLLGIQRCCLGRSFGRSRRQCAAHRDPCHRERRRQPPRRHRRRHLGVLPAASRGVPRLLAFTQPAVGGSVGVSVASTTGLVAGNKVYVDGGGYYNVAAVVSQTALTLTNLITVDNAAPGTVIPAALAGALNITSNASWATTAVFTQPAVGSAVVVSLASTTGINLGQTINIDDGGYYTVLGVLSPTSLLLENLGTASNALPAAVVEVPPPGFDNVSSNGTWRDINGNLDNAQLNAVASSPSGSGTLYGTGPGISTVRF